MTKYVEVEHLQSLLAHIIHTITDATFVLATQLQHLLNQDLTATQDLKILLSAPYRQQVQHTIQNILNNYEHCNGAGFASHVASHSQNGDYWILEWWFKDESRIEQAHLELDQGTQQRLDFRTFDWFHQASASDQTYVHGPYVDYICNTAYTITAAHPIYVETQFIGVAVVDILVATLEKRLIQTIKQIGCPVIITNQSDRVIISSLAKVRVGSIFKGNGQEIKIDQSEKHPFKIYVL
ncbi:MAG: cache domain-containing protein [Acinetobacter sp.]